MLKQFNQVCAEAVFSLIHVSMMPQGLVGAVRVQDGQHDNVCYQELFYVESVGQVAVQMDWYNFGNVLEYVNACAHVDKGELVSWVISVLIDD